LALALRSRLTRGPFAAGLAFALSLLATASAQAATTIGETGNAGSSCAPNITVGQGLTAAGTPSYTVPAGGGVIVSWSYAAPAGADQVKFKVIRPAGGTQFTVVGATATQTMTPNRVNTMRTRISVQAGDKIAITALNNNSGCAHSSVAGDSVEGCVGCDPAQGETYTAMPLSNNFRANVAAVIEPDADGDGFGDESQDACTTDPSSDTCAPPTITGIARVGSPLTASPNGQPSNPAFQWLRCDGAGANCSTIPGATSVSYTPGSADIGATLRFRKTATNATGTQSTDSAATTQVVENPSRCSTAFTGTTGADTIAGTAGGDRIRGLGGADNLSGGAGDDCLIGGTGPDRMRGGSGNDNLSGGSGNDRLSGESGNDVMTAGGGKNTVSSGAGDDVVNALNRKKDKIDCGGGRNDVARVDSSDTVRGCERVIRRR
jgi:Ca2+-binding RTX toxin-like protein